MVRVFFALTKSQYLRLKKKLWTSFLSDFYYLLSIQNVFSINQMLVKIWNYIKQQYPGVINQHHNQINLKNNWFESCGYIG